MENEHDISQSMNENIVHVRDDDREQSADDPRKGARILDKSWSYSISSILFEDQIVRNCQDKEELYIDDVMTKTL